MSPSSRIYLDDDFEESSLPEFRCEQSPVLAVDRMCRNHVESCNRKCATEILSLVIVLSRNRPGRRAEIPNAHVLVDCYRNC